jgi:hypothetical protein
LLFLCLAPAPCSFLIYSATENEVIAEKHGNFRIKEEDIMQKNGKVFFFSILVLLACISVVNADHVLLQGTTSDFGVVPTVHTHDNTVTCADAGCSGTQTLLIEQTGTYDGTYCIDATHCITIVADNVMSADEENSIDWTSNFDVECIVMKGSDGYDTYYCVDDHKRADGSMSTPINQINEKPAGISHILVCYFPPSTNVPEFPAWFISLMGIAGLVGMLIACQRK